MMNPMSQYHGIDWVAMCLTFTAIYLLGSKRRAGFVFMLAMNIRGFSKWSPTESTGCYECPPCCFSSDELSLR
jgi:hypothetical protein